MLLSLACARAFARRQLLLLAGAGAAALVCARPAGAAACDHIRHDQLKYAECMRNDPSRNTPSGRRQEYQPAPGQDEPAQESAYERERRLQRESAEAERKRREDEARDRELGAQLQALSGIEDRIGKLRQRLWLSSTDSTVSPAASAS